MSHAPRARLQRGKVQRGHYLLRLFVAGNGPNSRQALANLRRLGRERLKGRCTIEVVDVVKDFGAATRDNILITPALILVAPRPRVIVLGNLSDRQKVLLALRLSEGDS
jgi:circadian clock protein KaiB